MKEEAKMVYLLECLQKTPPPVSVAGRLALDSQDDGSVQWRQCTGGKLGTLDRGSPCD